MVAARVALAMALALLLSVTHARYYLAFSFAAVLVIWVSTRPSRWRYAAVVAMAAALWAIRWRFAEADGLTTDSVRERMVMTGLALLGAGALIMLAWRPPRDSRLGSVGVAAAFGVAGCGVLADRWFRFMTDHPLSSLDRVLYALDDRLGFQAGFDLGRMFHALPVLAFVAIAVYRMLPVMLVVVFVSLPPQQSLRIRFGISAAVAGAIGYYVYRLCPAAGPLYAFPGLYPHTPPLITAGWVAPIALPTSLLNAFPSLHTVWALLTLMWIPFVARAVRPWLVAGAALTILATLGSGEHYLVDLIAAVPFAVAFELPFTPRPLSIRRRVLGTAVCVALVALWVTGVRTQMFLEWNRAALVLMVAATVIVPVIVRLQDASGAADDLGGTESR